jgi:hypothetical protein
MLKDIINFYINDTRPQVRRLSAGRLSFVPAISGVRVSHGPPVSAAQITRTGDARQFLRRPGEFLGKRISGRPRRVLFFFLRDSNAHPRQSDMHHGGELILSVYIFRGLSSGNLDVLIFMFEEINEIFTINEFMQ